MSVSLLLLLPVVIVTLVLNVQHVYEDLLGMKFRIAPASFFQVNTPACGVLYDIIREAVAPEEGKKPVIYGRGGGDLAWTEMFS